MLKQKEQHEKKYPRQKKKLWVVDGYSLVTIMDIWMQTFMVRKKKNNYPGFPTTSLVGRGWELSAYCRRSASGLMRSPSPGK